MVWEALRGLWRRRARSAQLTDFARGVIPSAATAAGIAVTEQSALAAVPVYACVRVIAETMMALPVKLLRRLPSGALEPDPDQHLYHVLHDLANPALTAAEFRETLMGHVLLWGNAYAEIERDAAGRVRWLWPLRPDRMTVDLDETGRIRYTYRLSPSEVVVLRGPTDREPSQVFHLRGLSGDGVIGYSPIRIARDAIAAHLAAQEYGARFFANQAQPLGALVVPKGTSAKAIDHLRESWRVVHGGLSQAHRVAILEEGIQWQQIGIAPEDAQFLETRQYSTLEIARLFRVPPPLIGELGRATWANTEQLFLQFAQTVVVPWAVRWEQALKRDLFSLDMWRTHDIRVRVQGLMRGDMQSRYQAYAIGRQWGFLSADDIRALEDLNPLPNGIGQSYLTPLNMTERRSAEVDATALGLAAALEVEREAQHLWVH